MLALTSLSLSPQSGADLCFFGYTGVGPAVPSEPEGTYGIDHTALVFFSADDNQTTINTFPQAVNAAINSNARLFVDASRIFFKSVGTGPPVDCSDYGVPQFTPTAAFPVLKVRSELNDHYTTRWRNFIDTHRTLIDQHVEAIFIAIEVNNACVEQGTIWAFSNYFDSTLPGMPRAVAYGLPGNKPVPLPASFVGSLDMIAFWAYGVHDPFDPNDPLNLNSTVFYNPSNPTSTSTLWGKLLQARWSHQWFMVNLRGFYDDAAENGGWDLDSVAEMADNWRRWMAQRPEIEGAVSFSWQKPGAPWIQLGARDMVTQSPAYLAEVRQLTQQAASCP